MARRADKGQRPRWRFRERRAASCRLERPESAAFRRHLYDEERAAIVAELLGMERLDLDRLHELSYLREFAPVVGVVHAVIEPRVAYADHSDFDREVCLAGLKRFVRPIMPSDRRNDLAIDPDSGEWDTSGDDPAILGSAGVLVREVQPGFRIRKGLVYTGEPGRFIRFTPGQGPPKL
jgi:hypothetical protein